MKNEVRLKKGSLDYFKRKAKATPNEIQAYLIGEAVTPNLTIIDSFEYPHSKQYASSTPEECSWYTEDYLKVQKKADAREKRIVGFIHSHPEWDSVPSPADYDIMVTEGYRVCGICSVNNGKTRTRFWVMDSPLNCEIEYVEDERASS